MSHIKGYILLVGAEVALRERALAGAWRASSGCAVFTVTNHLLSPTLRYFDGHICAPISDHDEVLKQVINYERLTGMAPVAVIPTNDFTVVTAAIVAEHYKLPHNSMAVVNRCRDKFLMREHLQKHHLPVPRFAAVRNRADINEAIGTIGFPAIIKPRLMAGSLGVIKANTREELLEAFEESQRAVRSINGEANADETLFILEEYVDYEFEISVEVLNTPQFSKVIGMTDKYLGAPPHFVELGHVVPSFFTQNRDIVNLAENACRTLGIQYGIAHFEARVDRQGNLKIMEIAARTGGDSIMGLVEKVYGYNPYELHIRSYLEPDMRFDNDLTHADHLAAVAFLKAETGILQQISVPSSLPEALLYLNIFARVGDDIGPLTSWKNREGLIELFWRNRKQKDYRFTEHLTIAKTLSKEIFFVNTH